MTSQALSKGLPHGRQARPAGTLPFAGGGAELALALGRAHELCGPARRALALLLAGATEGPVLWVHAQHMAERLHPDGVAALCDPGRLVFVNCPHERDLLWCAEEGLRSGAAPVVVTELPAPPALTPVRRLHLAAEAGQERSGSPPLGLLLTPETGGAQGVESRWHMAGCCDAPAQARRSWRLECLRQRGGMPGIWRLDLHPEGPRAQR